MKSGGWQVIFFIIFYLLIVNCSLLFGIDFSLHPKGFAFIPSGDGNVTSDGSERYRIGGGGEINFELDIASVLSNPLGIGYTLGVEGGLFSSPFMHGGGQVNFYSFGGALGLYYFPFSRLPLRVEGGVGVYSANDGEEKTPSNLWYRFGGETGFRFTPGFTLTAGAGWRQFQGSDRPLSSGIYAGAGLRLTFEMGERSSGGAGVSLLQDDGVYPALTPLYQQFPIGSVKVRNNENAEIRGVKVFFRAGGYTSSEYQCGQAAIIPKGRSVEFPLYADFSPEVLRFADSGRILGEVVIRYTFLGREREAARTVSIAVYNRNTPVPGDNSALAAFVSVSSPDILQFSKYAAALARTNHRLGLNGNMETGVWLFEAIRQSIRIGQPIGSDVQFPAQTLAYGSGSLLDIALLYAAGLQAAGVSAAIIVLPNGEILCAASLGLDAASATAEALFNGPDKLLIMNDEVWLPAAVSRLGDGFTAAWNEAIRRIDGLIANGEEPEMIIIEEAWKTYPPAPFPALGARLVLPDSNAVNAAANAVVQNYIKSEFEPKLSAVREQIRRNPGASLYNQLGNLYLRSGMTSQANSVYEQAAGMGSTGAMVNRGNVALHENDIAAAERWFRQALAKDPNNKSALRGIEFVEVRK